MSEFFNCQIGLREGENVSPILFSFYLNDLRDHLSLANTGIVIDYDDNDTVKFLRMFLLLYADDTVLFANSKENMEKLLNKYKELAEYPFIERDQ